jgi:transposase
MSKTRKYPATDEKAIVLKRYLVEKVPMSDLCDEYGLRPSQIYRWQKQLFENAAGTFRRTNKRAEDAKNRKHAR